MSLRIINWIATTDRIGGQVVILFGSGACANCCLEWFAPDYPILHLNKSGPSLRGLPGKILDVQGRKIV